MVKITSLTITKKVLGTKQSPYIRISPNEYELLGKPNNIKATIISKQTETKNVICPFCNNVVTVNTDFPSLECPFCDKICDLSQCKQFINDVEVQTILPDFFINELKFKNDLIQAEKSFLTFCIYIIKKGNIQTDFIIKSDLRKAFEKYKNFYSTKNISDKSIKTILLKTYNIIEKYKLINGKQQNCWLGLKLNIEELNKLK